MFSSLGLFKDVACPHQAQCPLPKCIFAHSAVSDTAAERSKQSTSSTVPEGDEDNSLKEKHRTDSGKKPPAHGSRVQENPSAAAVEPSKPSFSSPLPEDEEAYPPRKKQNLHDERRNTNFGHHGPLFSRDMHSIVRMPKTAERPVSPPPLRSSLNGDNLPSTPTQKTSKPKSKPRHRFSDTLLPPPKGVVTSLNPRMLAKPPATHPVRIQLVTMLHQQMTRLNEEVKKFDHRSKDIVQLEPLELIIFALLEEEKIAIENPAVYSNVIKLRIVKLKKMGVDEWVHDLLTRLSSNILKEESSQTKEDSKVIETGLTSQEEIAFLPRLLADQSNLAKHGYVTAPISDADIEEARRGLKAAHGWEQCDRCRTRFQVFPGRREEDGAHTSGGQCLHHPGKPRRPTVQDKQDKADRAVRESFYTCCNEAVSVSAGCTTATTHVFKVSEAKRLALIMPFETTPSNPTCSDAKTAVCFDCEMGYTTMGLELIRLTATSWPSGSLLVDVLVRPLGEILDLNSRYSGVWPKDFASALPYDPSSSSSSSSTSPSIQTSTDPHITTTTKTSINNNPPPPLRLVPHPTVARSLLFTHLSPTTPLIGHALDNDLNTTRIIHPSIIDTVLLYPHPRGLPLRFGLKALMKRHLDVDIQMGIMSSSAGDKREGQGQGQGQGHDSAEDARAAGELVRLKVGELWKKEKKQREKD